jgi:hypothetical protein
MTKVGFMVTIQKQITNRLSGRAHKHQEKKRSGRSGVQQTACSLFLFYAKGIVHREFVPSNTTVNSEFYSYCDVLRRLRENVRRKRSEIWRKHNWLLHDNASTHMSLKTTEFVTNKNMVIVPHPHYSPDLVPCDFSLFPKLRMKLKQCLTS